MFKKVIAFFISFCFAFEQVGFAQIAGQLDISSRMSSMYSSMVFERYRPLHLRYLSYDQLTNDFKLLLDKGSAKENKPEVLEKATGELLKYFFIGIALPNSTFWVNLRPDSPKEIIDDNLAKTDIGKVMLECDLQLKKDTAKYTSPETLEGREYWDKLYKRAEELYGSENITIPTLTRPWIVPDEIIVREAKGSAYIYKATLKVMLEQDYLKGDANYSFPDEKSKILNEYSSQIIRETIIPKLTREVNSSKRYASLRQVYYSLILAQWFKQSQKDTKSQVTSKIDTKDLNNLTSKAKWDKDTYFKAYQKSFKDGEYNIRENRQSPYGQTIRTYFSGGTDLDMGRFPYNTDGGKGIMTVTSDDLEATIKALPLAQVASNGNGDVIVQNINDNGIKTDSNLPGGGKQVSVEPLNNQQKNAALIKLLAILNNASAGPSVDAATKTKLQDFVKTFTRSQFDDLMSFREKKETSRIYAAAALISTGFMAIGISAFAIDASMPLLVAGAVVYLAIATIGSWKFLWEVVKLADIQIAANKLLAEPEGLFFLDGKSNVALPDGGTIDEQIEQTKLQLKGIETELFDIGIQAKLALVEKWSPARWGLKKSLQNPRSAVEIARLKADKANLEKKLNDLKEAKHKEEVLNIARIVANKGSIFVADPELKRSLGGNIDSSIVGKAEAQKLEAVKEALGPEAKAEFIREVSKAITLEFVDILYKSGTAGPVTYVFKPSVADGGNDKGDVVPMKVRIFYKTDEAYSNIVSHDDGVAEFLDWLKVPAEFKYHEAIHIDNNLNKWIKAKGVEIPEFLQIVLDSGFQPINDRENEVIGKEAQIFNTIEIYPAFNEKGEISADSVFVRARRSRADGRVYFPTREIKLKNFKLEVPKGMTIEEILPSRYKRTVLDNLESQAKDGGRDSMLIDNRGFDGLPNDEYTPQIREAIVSGKLVNCVKRNGRLVQEEFVADSDVIDSTGQTRAKGSAISVDQQQRRLTDEELKSLNDLMSDLSASGALEEGMQLVFIPGMLAHYSLGRSQIYLDLNLVKIKSAPLNWQNMELVERIFHEILERQNVFEGLTPEERATIQATRFDPASRPKSLQDKIESISKKIHISLKEMEWDSFRTMLLSKNMPESFLNRMTAFSETLTFNQLLSGANVPPGPAVPISKLKGGELFRAGLKANRPIRVLPWDALEAVVPGKSRQILQLLIANGILVNRNEGAGFIYMLPYARSYTDSDAAIYRGIPFENPYTRPNQLQLTDDPSERNENYEKVRAFPPTITLADGRSVKITVEEQKAVFEQLRTIRRINETIEAGWFYKVRTSSPQELIEAMNIISWANPHKFADALALWGKEAVPLLMDMLLNNPDDPRNYYGIDALKQINPDMRPYHDRLAKFIDYRLDDYYARYNKAAIKLVDSGYLGSALVLFKNSGISEKDIDLILKVSLSYFNGRDQMYQMLALLAPSLSPASVEKAIATLGDISKQLIAYSDKRERGEITDLIALLRQNVQGSKKELKYDGGVPENPWQAESSRSQPAPGRTGGIDFRALPITTQPMGEILMKEIINMPAVNIADLDQEWQAMQKMIEADACPSAQRIKEFLGACYQKGELKQRADKILACLAGMLRLEEDEYKATEPQVKVMLALLEYNR